MRGAKHRRVFLLRFAAAIAFVLSAGTVHGDEFHLKDGSKIIGTIVGFEDGAFKVQTTYGFAYVRKESIAEIVPAEKKAGPDSDQPAPALKPSALTTTSSNGKPAVPPMPKPIPKYVTAPSKPAASSTNVAPPAIAASPASLLLPNLSGLVLAGEGVDPRPQAMQELVRGNVYVNQTFGFQMYKPPTWQVIKNPQDQLPNAIGALGTEDQNTLLVVGRDPLSESLEAMAAKREKTLRDVYENYRQIGKKQITVAGLPAVQQRFYGSLDGHDWSVTFTMLARGKDVFTILGMTSADSDLIQIQENVIAKTIASLQFLSPQ